MSQNRNAISIGFNLLSLIPSLIKAVELFAGHASGAEKRAAVIDLATGTLAGAAQAVAANNPQYKDAIGAVIDSSVPVLRSAGQMPEPIALPVPPVAVDSSVPALVPAP